ncbi:dTDP-4-dehydrorhamnose reductase [Phycicoccus sp. SLBN-51]|uniref:dTDP-4-dehydrorhamnose reductase n=1 Tax=Phycicoccus sp. SLBN-51 TaxID=2768447 RepID=UPI00115318AE|nr:dTDP-4-dehydrorhamnose reductase [Phycicoccus sp. SLBN-51]TQJ49863.1 dTDP-4-dehydrorhamnose reductase [Phycicoccus sp. SLBN-51]
MTRWLVVGAGGMLGQDLCTALEMAGIAFTASRSASLDIRDHDACSRAVVGHAIVVNCAAYTAVDDAESHEADAFALNAIGAANLARAAREHGARMVQVSTDYVFAGDADEPYAEDAPLAPRSAYGRTKAAGEWAVEAHCPESWIVRTAWLYGAGGGNFVRTMARLAGERDTLSVVDDQRGQPTWTVDLADAIVRIVTSNAPFGVWHGTSSGETTWHGFTQEIFRQLGLDPSRVEPTKTDAFPRPAPRPAYSVLGHEGWRMARLAPLPGWRESLAKALPSVVSTV